MYNSRNVVCARVQLERAQADTEGVDPVSGYSADEIRDYLREIAEDLLSPPDVTAAASATLRRRSS